MVKHGKKFVAPVIVTFCIILYYSTIVFVLYKINLPKFVIVIALVFSVIAAIALIFVLIERIKEIRKGEEDDLGKY